MANLTQTGVTLTVGQTYSISFEVEVSAGSFTVFQGTQQIYDWGIREPSVYDGVWINESISFYTRSPIDVSDSVGITESVSLTIS